jgi:hypothetical protein
MLGIVILRDANREPLICKLIEDFNEYLKFIDGSYGLIFEYNQEENKMIATKRCNYIRGLNVISEDEDRKISYDFSTICKECQKNNNMYDTYRPCIKCPEDNCKYCKQFYVECQCDIAP